VFGMTADVQGGFNEMLACCNSAPGAFMVTPVRHGAFIEDARGEWVKALVADARADRRGVSYTIRPDAYWYWGGKRVPLEHPGLALEGMTAHL